MSKYGYIHDRDRMAEVIAIEKRDEWCERSIMRVLRSANGAKLTSREIYQTLGFDPEAPENWNRVCTIVWWLEKLISIKRIETEGYGLAQLYFITPPKEVDRAAA